MSDNLDLRSLVDQNHLAFFYKDLRGRYLAINEAGAQMLGRTREQVIGKNDADLFGAATVRLMKEREQYIVGLDRAHEYDAVSEVGGRWMLFHSAKIAIKNTERYPAGILGFSANMTALRDLRKQDVIRLAASTMNQAPSKILERFFGETTLLPNLAPGHALDLSKRSLN